MLHQADFLILTNNPLVVKCLGNDYEIRFEKDYSYRDILIEARDLVYKGHTLYTHPLSGSVKPNETPYRSVALTEETGPLDLESLRLIEDALVTFRKFRPRAGRGMDASPSMKEDFAEIDLRLIAGAISPHLDD